MSSLNCSPRDEKIESDKKKLTCPTTEPPLSYNLARLLSPPQILQYHADIYQKSAAAP